MSMIAIIGASGKIGGATLNSLLTYTSTRPSSIIALTTSPPSSSAWEKLSCLGVTVRQASFDDPSSLEAALQGVDKFFLVSSPTVALDHRDAPEGQGREKQHFAAIDAAKKVGVKHIYYTSLAFGDDSKAGVMAAHLRTERYLQGMSEIKWTSIREGLYNESWPLYLGYFDISGDERSTIKIGGEGKISWASIADLGIASALVVADESDKYVGKTVVLSTPASTAKSLREIKDIVAEKVGHPLEVENVGQKEFERYYIKDMGRDELDVKWWSSTFPALERGELVKDDPSLTELLASVGRKPVPIEETIRNGEVRVHASHKIGK